MCIVQKREEKKSNLGFEINFGGFVRNRLLLFDDAPEVLDSVLDEPAVLPVLYFRNFHLHPLVQTRGAEFAEYDVQRALVVMISVGQRFVLLVRPDVKTDLDYS